MPLLLKLKPKESVIMGGTLIRNGETPCRLSVENRVPILREKDIMQESDATSHCRRIYFLLQLMYLEQKRVKEHYDVYLGLVKDLIKAAPSMVEMLYSISEHVLADEFYKALKVARRLVDREDELLGQVKI